MRVRGHGWRHGLEMAAGMVVPWAAVLALVGLAAWIWTLVLTAIGFATVGKVKQGTAMAIVFGWYILFALAGAGLGAAFA